MSYTVGSGTNTFIPTFDAQDGLIVAFSRDVKSFAVNRYSQIIPVTQSAGKYLRIAMGHAARSQFTDGRESVWHDGNDRPSGEYNKIPFEFEPYLTTRHDYPFILGRKAVEQAQFQIQQVHVDAMGMQAMTERTVLALQALTSTNFSPNAANVDGANPAINGVGPLLASGQNWTNGSATAPNIKISLQAGIQAINLATFGSVQPSQLKLVIAPDAAFKMSQSPEVQQAFIQSQYALPQLAGDAKGQNANWGLPPSLYGVEVEVEGTVRNTANVGAADALGYAIPYGSAYLVSRTGGLVGVEGGKNFSTLLGFFYEEFTVEAFDDPQNRRVQGHVTSDFVYTVSSPATGYLFTHIFG